MQSTTRDARRDDIQGLRAVGALLVAVFHIWIGRVSGGVDVFFVVSGYLLIGSLVREAVRTATIELLKYFARLAKRLLPASLIVLVFVIVSAPFWLPSLRWALTAKHVAASALYVENWYLIKTSSDYLTRNEATSPVQHYWAMSLQVQSLVLIGIVLWAAMLCIRGTTVNRTRYATILLSVLFAASLTWSIVHTDQDQPVAYFDTFARLWEFALGGLLAIVLPRLKLSANLRLVLGWGGLALIVSCGMILQVSRLFPGYAALWPTIGAALVLVGGAGAHRLGVARLLSTPALVWLGDRSYGLYLWHWPILLAYLTITVRETATPFAGAVILAASVFAADLTLRFVEKPPRKLSDDKPLRLIAGAAASVGLCVGLSYLAIGYVKRAEQRELTRLAENPSLYPGAAVFGRNHAEAPVTPGPYSARGDRPELYRNGCHLAGKAIAVKPCVYGDKGARYSIALIGGSHAAQWFGALRKVVKASGWRLLVITKSGCQFKVYGRLNTYRCAEWNANVMAWLKRNRPNAIFTTTTRGSSSGEYIPAGYVERWRELQQLGIPIVGVRNTPRMGFDVVECVDRFGRSSEHCSRPRTEMLKDTNPALAVNGVKFLHHVDLSEYFCSKTKCRPVEGNVMIYYDESHFSNTYSETLAPMLLQKLSPIMRAIETRPEVIASR